MRSLCPRCRQEVKMRPYGIMWECPECGAILRTEEIKVTDDG